MKQPQFIQTRRSQGLPSLNRPKGRLKLPDDSSYKPRVLLKAATYGAAVGSAVLWLLLKLLTNWLP